eukprot:5975415-Pleurochrysis_carterae.AAC.1
MAPEASTDGASVASALAAARRQEQLAKGREMHVRAQLQQLQRAHDLLLLRRSPELGPSGCSELVPETANAALQVDLDAELREREQLHAKVLRLDMMQQDDEIRSAKRRCRQLEMQQAARVQTFTEEKCASTYAFTFALRSAHACTQTEEDSVPVSPQQRT